MVAHSGMRLPYVVDVKRGSDVDGPGLRSVVFFKGCPLRCQFCHNPETQQAAPEIAFNQRECIRCGHCVAACAAAAIDLSSPGRLDRDRCTTCGACAAICPTSALRMIGRRFEVEELVALLLQDEPFYRHSGGGVTFSGGECTLYPEYLSAVAALLKSAGIHVAIETSGLFDWSTFRELILPCVDLVFYDLKVMDPETAHRVTGASSTPVLENLLRLLATGVEVRPTVPLIPGLTANPENLGAMVDFLKTAGASRIEPRAWNPLGIDSYRRLGRPVPDLPERLLRPDEEKTVLDFLRAAIAACKSNQLRQAANSPVQP